MPLLDVYRDPNGKIRGFENYVCPYGLDEA
jgi:hypothetical protein